LPSSPLPPRAPSSRPGATSRASAGSHHSWPFHFFASPAARGAPCAGRTPPSGRSFGLAFLPGSGRVVSLGQLPAPTTHGAAASLGHIAYLVGGRGTDPNTPTARIVAIDPARRRVRGAGHLSAPRSDLAAVSLGNRIVLAGGRVQEGSGSSTAGG
jgi:hypothetical protein